MSCNNNDIWYFYEDNAGEWRWTRRARNGETVGASTEGYSTLYNCKENARRSGWSEDCDTRYQKP